MRRLVGSEQAPAVEPSRRKGHYFLIHTVLYRQQTDRLRPQRHHLLHQRVGQASFGCLQTLHRWRQLLVVSAHHHPVGLQHRRPASGLQRLGCLVNEQCGEVAAFHEAVGAAYQRTTHHPGLLKKVCIYLDFQFRLAVAQTVGLLTFGTLAQRLAYVPQLVIVGVRCIAALITTVEHLVAHPQRIAHPQHMDTATHQLLADPIHRSIARCTHKHLRLTLQCLDDGLHQRSGLARPRRTVHNGHLLRLHHTLYGVLLTTVEPRKTQLWQHAERRRPLTQEHLAQPHEALILLTLRLMQSFGHHAESSVVNSQLHPQQVPFGSVVQTLSGCLVGQAERHRAVTHTLHIALVRQLLGTAIGQIKESHRLSRLEVELHLVFVHLIAHFHRKLSQGVVGVVAQPYRIATSGLVDGPRQRGTLLLKAALVGALLLLQFLRNQRAQMCKIIADGQSSISFSIRSSPQMLFMLAPPSRRLILPFCSRWMR